MDTSNRTLALFLAAAIIVSIAGTAISLNKLQALSPDRENGPTGFATTGTGNVSLVVNQNLAITVPTAYIRFGQCTPASSRAVNISSNLAYGNQSAQAGSACNGTGNWNLPESIIIRNTGNIIANVTMNASKAGDADGGTFLPSTSGASRIWYQAWNVTNTGFNTSLNGLVSGGCHGTMQNALRIITSVDMDTLPICDNLENRGGTTHNAVGINVTIQLPSDITAGDSIQFDIWAKASI